MWNKQKPMPHKLENIKAVLVDADDTIWENNLFFMQASAWLCTVGRRFGFTDKAVMEMLAAWERLNIPILGFSYHSFETSFLATLRQICLTGWGFASEHAGHRQRALRWMKFLRSHPIVLMPGVEETLPHLARTYQTIVVTKGNVHDQMSKVYRSGLAPLFHAVEVVPRKTPADYQRVLDRHGLKAEEVVMIGNSPSSDINQPKKLGIRTIFVPHPQTWAFELEPISMEKPETIELPHFGALAEVLHLPIA